MRIDGQHYRTIWHDPARPGEVQVIDQRHFPDRHDVRAISSASEMAHAIQDMTVRGAPLIGVAGAYGVYLAVGEAAAMPNPGAHFAALCDLLRHSRPTAVNLAWAVAQQQAKAANIEAEYAPIQPYLGVTSAWAVPGFVPTLAYACLANAGRMAEDDVAACSAIGEAGLPLIREIAARKGGEPVHILTHCNAGWMACIDWGTATAPIYKAHLEGIAVHVWVSETRPRNQGGRITAWELGQEGVPHTIVTDSACAHLMQHGMVDLCIVGADRVTSQGDTANKIGTYLKAIAAQAHGVPFYVALPSPTLDMGMADGVASIPIETRGEEEIHYTAGLARASGLAAEVRTTPLRSAAFNPGFDVTPARYVTAFITEYGLVPPTAEGLAEFANVAANN